MSSLKPEPLPLELYSEAKDLNVKLFWLNWQGGSDEGYLNVEVDYDDNPQHLEEIGQPTHQLLLKYYRHNAVEPELSEEQYEYAKKIHSSRSKFEQNVENWAWDNFYYSGAGDGSDYGDDVKYDLQNNTVEVTDWWMTREEGSTDVSEVTIVSADDGGGA